MNRIYVLTHEHKVYGDDELLLVGSFIASTNYEHVNFYLAGKSTCVQVFTAGENRVCSSFIPASYLEYLGEL